MHLTSSFCGFLTLGGSDVIALRVLGTQSVFWAPNRSNGRADGGPGCGRPCWPAGAQGGLKLGLDLHLTSSFCSFLGKRCFRRHRFTCFEHSFVPTAGQTTARAAGSRAGCPGPAPGGRRAGGRGGLNPCPGRHRFSSPPYRFTRKTYEYDVFYHTAHTRPRER